MSRQPITSSDLLAWSIVNQATEQEDRTGPTEPHEPIDPKWIDVILGKPDAARMRDCMDIILNKEKSLEIRLANCDELELLVESVDNALDLQPLGLWPLLLSIIERSEEEAAELRMYAAWIAATATQNNPKAQEAFERARGIPIVLKALDQDQDAAVRIKCLYCVSAAIRHNPKTFATFTESSGFAICANACKQGDPVLLKRTLFLLSTLLHPQDDSTLEVSGKVGSVANSTMNAILEHGILGMAIELLDSPDQLPLDDSLGFLLAALLYNPSVLRNEKNTLLEKLDVIEREFLTDQDESEIIKKIAHLRSLVAS